MTSAFFKELGRQTLTDPRGAAARLIALDLPANWLWMALALMTVLNSIVYSVPLHLSQNSTPAAVEMFPPLLRSPVFFTLFLGGGLVVAVCALTWIGRAMGGKARMADVLVLITWLQVLRLVVQVISLVLMMTMPILMGIVVIAATIWGLFILVAFLDRANGFGGWGKAAVLLVLTGAAMILVLSLVLQVVGVTMIHGA